MIQFHRLPLLPVLQTNNNNNNNNNITTIRTTENVTNNILPFYNCCLTNSSFYSTPCSVAFVVVVVVARPSCLSVIFACEHVPGTTCSLSQIHESLGWNVACFTMQHEYYFNTSAPSLTITV